MSALKLSNPVIFSIGMIADNLSFHVNVIARARAPGIHWVEPKLVAEITYLTWTGDGLLRHTVYVGLRGDKSADQVRRER